MTQKLTPWFDGSVLPARRGPYLRQYDSGREYYCKWDGEDWLFPAETPKLAKSEDIKSCAQNLPWRGLAVKP